MIIMRENTKTVKSNEATLKSLEEMKKNNTEHPLHSLKNHTITIKVFRYGHHSNMVHGDRLTMNDVRAGLV